MVPPKRMRRILRQLLAGNFVWEVPAEDHYVQFDERLGRELSVYQQDVDHLEALGYVTRVAHDASARRLDCWIPTDKAREYLESVRRRG